MTRILCWLTLLFYGVHAESAHAERPNVLLIVSDDQRPDTIAALGNNVIKTPALDRLVRRGTAFSRATCANPICTPSRAEILTGCHGIRNEVFDFGRTINPELPTLPEPFAKAGYKTWYCGKWHNNGRPGLHGYQETNRLYTGGGGKWWKPQNDYRGHPITGYRGWIFRDADYKPLPKLGVGLTPDISGLIADAAIEIIEESNEPFFVHLNFTAPHDPLLVHEDFRDVYEPAEIPLPNNFLPEHPFDHGNQGGRDEVLLPFPRTAGVVKKDIAAYYAVISHMDDQIGRILDALQIAGKQENTIVVFTSDHGLAIGSHGLRGKQNMYEHTIGVPMIFAGPGIPENRIVQGQTYLRDIFPTLCDMAKLPIPDVDGISQVPVILGEQKSAHQYVVGYFRDSQRMIRGQRWKLIHYPKIDKTQLFDLLSDPSECNDQSENPMHVAIKKQLRMKLEQWIHDSSNSK